MAIRGIHRAWDRRMRTLIGRAVEWIDFRRWPAALLSQLDAECRVRSKTGEILERLEAARPRLYRRLNRTIQDPIAAKALTLKILNLFLARHHFVSRDCEVTSRPFGLVVDPSNHCHLSCPGCVHSSRNQTLRVFDWDKGMLSEARLNALLEEYGAYAVQVVFCNYGEPILNVRTPKLIQLAKSYLAQTLVSSNLSIRALDADAYVECGLDFLVASIDGATRPVYERFRKNGSLALVFRNVENLVAAKQRLRSPTPIIRWQFLAFEHNKHEIPAALEMARGLGIDQFAVRVPFDVAWDDPGVRIAESASPMVTEFGDNPELKLYENWNRIRPGPAAAVIEREFDRRWTAVPFADERRREPGHTCHWLYKNIVMDANGRILPCCCAPAPGMNLVSAIVDQHAAGIFNSEWYRRARQHFSEPARPPAADDPYCRRCNWRQDHTQVGPEHIAQFLHSASRGKMDSAAIELLSKW